jgi:outer membrane protein OmpA-like peptidoglycan-associated protein/ABC-type nitrate/sulfonate/bicarbonate transport system substrate-binding protein
MGSKGINPIFAIAIPAVAVVGVGLISYASSLGDKSAATLAAAPPPTRLKVAGDPASGYSTFRKEPRFMEALLEDHVDLDYLNEEKFYDPSERMRSLSVGTLDVAVMTLDAFIQFGARYQKAGQYPGVVLFAIDESSGADAIFMAKGRSSFDDVKPADEVCLTPGTSSEHLWDFASQSFAALGNGLVVEKDVVAKDCWDKLEAGRVHIAVLSQPYTALAVKAGYPKVFATGGPADDLILDVAVAGRDALATKREALKHFVSAYFATVDAQVKDPAAHAAFVTKDCGKDCAADAALGAAVLESLDFLTLEENACLWFGFCGGASKLAERVGKTARLLTAKGKLDTRALPEPAALLDTSILKALHDDRARATRAPDSAEAPAVAAAPEQKPAEERAPKERVYSYTAGAARTGTPVGTLELPNVAFAEASHTLNEEGRAKVGLIAETLRGFPALCVRIVGHTNSTGDKEANRHLSKSRALAIAEHLTRIDPTVFPKERFDVQGMGSDRPVLVNTVEDKIASRRTDFTLIDCAD